MDTIWLVVLGTMFGGWAILDGANLGLGMSLRRAGGTRSERRLLLTALGPFLLAGEVWLVAAVGLLIGAFPGLESDLLRAFYPLIVALVVAWMLRDIGVWFRSRRPSQTWRAGWERVVVVTSTAFVFSWGLLLGNVVQGVPHDGVPGVETLVGPYSSLWGATMVAVFATHGAVFTALRMPREHRTRALPTAHRAGVAAMSLLAVLAAVTAVLGVDLSRPALAVLVASVGVAAVPTALHLLGRGADGAAFASTAVMTFAPLAGAGVATAPRLLDGAADPSTLSLLAGIAFPVLPVLLAAQVWMWSMFRHRVGTGSAVFF